MLVSECIHGTLESPFCPSKLLLYNVDSYTEVSHTKDAGFLLRLSRDNPVMKLETFITLNIFDYSINGWKHLQRIIDSKLRWQKTSNPILGYLIQ